MREIALLIYGMLHSMADISQSARDTILLRSNGDRDISGYFRKWARHNIANALFQSCVLLVSYTRTLDEAYTTNKIQMWLHGALLDNFSLYAALRIS